jgi:hypothetical protein
MLYHRTSRVMVRLEIKQELLSCTNFCGRSRNLEARKHACCLPACGLDSSLGTLSTVPDSSIVCASLIRALYMPF